MSKEHFPPFSGIELMPDGMTDAEKNGALLMARVQAIEFLVTAMFLTHPTPRDVLNKYDLMSASFGEFAQTLDFEAAKPLLHGVAQYLQLFRYRLVLTGDDGQTRGVN